MRNKKKHPKYQVSGFGNMLNFGGKKASKWVGQKKFRKARQQTKFAQRVNPVGNEGFFTISFSADAEKLWGK